MYQKLERWQDNEKAGGRKRLFCCKVLYIKEIKQYFSGAGQQKTPRYIVIPSNLEKTI